MIVFSTFVFPDFKNHRVESATGPPNGAILPRQILTLIEIVGMTKYLLRFFKSDPAMWILSKNSTLLLVKLEAHKIDFIAWDGNPANSYESKDGESKLTEGAGAI